VKELCATIPNAYWTNQYGNLDAVEAHYELTAAEICADFDSLDYVFIGVSTAGTIAGVSRRLKEHYPNIRVIAVDAEGSAIFGGTPRKRHIPGIGSSIVPQLLSRAKIDDIVLSIRAGDRFKRAGNSSRATDCSWVGPAAQRSRRSSDMRRGCRRTSTPPCSSCARTAARPTSTRSSIPPGRPGWSSGVGEAMHFELSIVNGKTVFDIVRAHRSECIQVVRGRVSRARGRTVRQPR